MVELIQNSFTNIERVMVHDKQLEVVIPLLLRVEIADHMITICSVNRLQFSYRKQVISMKIPTAVLCTLVTYEY